MGVVFGFRATPPPKNIVVLGASYGGCRAAKMLAELLVDRPDYRVILIDRNSHMNHLYVFPRFSILPGHEYKAFVPYTHVFGKEAERHLVVHAQVLEITKHAVTVSYTGSAPHPHLNEPSVVIDGETIQTIPFEYAIYALGASLPDPINVWKPWKLNKIFNPDRSPTPSPTPSISHLSFFDLEGTKTTSSSWLLHEQKRVEGMRSVLVVGGGALGVQMASDIASVYPDKEVTLIHSRNQLLPVYNFKLHEYLLKALLALKVNVVLGQRLNMDSIREPKYDDEGRQIVWTSTGDCYKAHVVLLCTGSDPNTKVIASGLGSGVIDPSTRLVRVLRSLQVVNYPVVDASTSKEAKDEAQDDEKTNPFPHIFAIGDAADAFGAIKAGHTAYLQGEVAARNISSLIRNGPTTSLEDYHPGEPAIKVSAGLGKAVIQHGAKVTEKGDEPDDLHVKMVWEMMGFQGDFDMHQ
ncbi:FAD/NAD(P)-binding domain-containing protein [Serendipita vermifera]|nr:FAD/NAD(P)-binding domain-containing protein [Serendipita vermifera]